jgi:hypothetical protein
LDVEFIAQPDKRVGDVIDRSFASRGTPQEFVLVSAFASLATVLRMKSRVAAVRDTGGDARMVLGVDLGGTSKEVLQEVSAWSIPVTIVKNRLFGVTFHPKLYMMRWEDHAELLVGSNNLTDGGLYRNYEAATRAIYYLPADAHAFAKAQSELSRFIKPSGPVATALTASYLSSLLAAPEIPSEASARKARAEGIPKRPPSSLFGYEAIPPAPKGPTAAAPPTPHSSAAAASSHVLPSVKSKVAGTGKTDALVIQVRAHHNGEIFLSKTAALQNPAFFGWPFNGLTTPKKAGNTSYPQLAPDPIVDINVYGAGATPVLIRSAYPLNTVYYQTKSEIRITASPLVSVMPDDSIMIIRRSDAPGRDYDIVIHRPDSGSYSKWLAVCDQKMPGGGKVPRRFGWV